MRIKLQYSVEQLKTVSKECEVELDEQELQQMLDHLPQGQNRHNASPLDLMNYLEGHGKFSTWIEMAAGHEEMRDLLGTLAYLAHSSNHPSRVIKNEFVAEGEDRVRKLNGATNVSN